MAKYRLLLACRDATKSNKRFVTVVECESRSSYFFENQELYDIISYYEYCGFLVKELQCDRLDKNNHLKYSIFYSNIGEV